MFDDDNDKFFGRNLFVLRDQKWRDMRSTLSPAFTGSKMRHMFSLITNICHDYMKELNRTIKTEKEMDFMDLGSKFCNDVIGKCSFGVSVNSLVQPDNEFYAMGHAVTRFPFKQKLKFICSSAVPKIMSVSLFRCLTLSNLINLIPKASQNPNV